MAEHYQLKCRECGKLWGNQARSFCDECLSPLEVVYDLDAIRPIFTRKNIEAGPTNLWRYSALLPLPEDYQGTVAAGFTPLVQARRLGKQLGTTNLYLKNDAVCFPTLSFKDRVVATALAAARRFGFQVVSCSSTGNLANAVAAQAARFVNVNLRPYYAEGSKTVGYEIAEQLGWRLPDNIVCPMAGGSLITKIRKSFNELVALGLVEEKKVKFFGAQATGCSPISDAVKRKLDHFEPQKPATIARSLAIGNPADGYYAARAIRESGGWAEDISDPDIVKGIQLLAETEGIFTETAGGVTTGVTQKLLEQGYINPSETTVACITGNGLKTIDAISQVYALTPAIEPRLTVFENFINDRLVAVAGN